MRITVLADNVSNDKELFAQHGLSLYIETQSKKILFDMGQDGLFLDNAKKLGIAMDSVDAAVLSHGHYDHGGGLKIFFEKNRTACVFVRPEAFGEFFNSENKYIGLENHTEYSHRFCFAADCTALDENMMLITCTKKELPYPHTSFGLTKKDGEENVPDDFCHEQYLLINENNKKILISGCSHKGICNIAEIFRPDVLVGGFHLSKLDPSDPDSAEKLRSVAYTLGALDTVYYTCHCTGLAQYEFLKSNGCPNLTYLSCGMTVEL